MKSDKDLSVGINKELLLTPKLLEEIGVITLLFVGLEFSVKLTISKLMPSTEAKSTLRLLAGDNFTALISKLKRMSHYKINDKDLLNEFVNICKELNIIKEQRNTLNHSLFAIDQNNMFTVFKLKSDKSTESFLYSEEQQIETPEQLIKRIQTAINALSDLNKKIIKLFDEKPKKKQMPKNKQKTKHKKKLEKPLKLNMSFDEAIKRIVNTKVKKKK